MHISLYNETVIVVHGVFSIKENTLHLNNTLKTRLKEDALFTTLIS